MFSNLPSLFLLASVANRRNNEEEHEVSESTNGDKGFASSKDTEEDKLVFCLFKVLRRSLLVAIIIGALFGLGVLLTNL